MNDVYTQHALTPLAVDALATLVKIAEECVDLRVRGECLMALQLTQRSSDAAEKLAALAWDVGGMSSELAKNNVGEMERERRAKYVAERTDSSLRI